MKPIEFPGRNVVFAAGQPQYIPLPAHISYTVSGRTTFCWSLSWKERLRVLFTGKIWQQVLTFHKPLQPQKLLAEKPEL